MEKIKNRIISYLVLLVIYWFSTSILISIDTKLKTNNVFITLAIGFAIIDIIYSFIVLKWNLLANMTFSILIAIISLFLAIRVGEIVLFPHFDPYGILTSIISNALLSIIFWEIIYQLKMISNQKNGE